MSDDVIAATLVNDQSRQQGCLTVGLLTAGRSFVHFLVLIIVFFVLCGPFHFFMQFYEHEEIKLPAMTIQMAEMAHRMSTHFFVIIPALLLIDLGALLLFQLLPRPWRYGARIWFSSVLFGAVIFLAFAMLAVWVPMQARFLVDQEGHLVDRPTVIDNE